MNETQGISSTQGQSAAQGIVETQKAGIAAIQSKQQESGLGQQMQNKIDQTAVKQVTEAEHNDDPEFAKKFSALTRKQKEIYEMQKALKERETVVSKYESLEKLKKENPFEYIKQQGLDLNEVLEYAAKQGDGPTIEDKVTDIEKRIQAHLDELKAKELDQKTKAEQAAIDNFRNSLKTHIVGKSDEYELINAQDEYDSVFELIQEHFNQTQAQTGQGEVLDFDKAAKLVEDHLLENAKKLLGLKKLAIKQPEQTKPTGAFEKPQSFGAMAQTLSSSVNAQAEPPIARNLSKEERLAEAARLVRWNT